MRSIHALRAFKLASMTYTALNEFSICARTFCEIYLRWPVKQEPDIYSYAHNRLYQPQWYWFWQTPLTRLTVIAYRMVGISSLVGYCTPPQRKVCLDMMMGIHRGDAWTISKLIIGVERPLRSYLVGTARGL